MKRQKTADDLVSDYSYNSALVGIVGVKASVLLAYLIAQTTGLSQEDEWVSFTAVELELATGLTDTEQRSARKKLRETGLIEERLVGIPPKMVFRVIHNVVFPKMDVMRREKFVEAEAYLKREFRYE